MYATKHKPYLGDIKIINASTTKKKKTAQSKSFHNRRLEKEELNQAQENKIRE